MTDNNKTRDNNSTEGHVAAIIPNSVLFNKTAQVINKKYSCPLSEKDAPAIDYKNLDLLKKYTSEKGKILPSRITGVCKQKQAKLKEAIKKARLLGLVPFSAN